MLLSREDALIISQRAFPFDGIVQPFLQCIRGVSKCSHDCLNAKPRQNHADAEMLDMRTEIVIWNDGVPGVLFEYAYTPRALFTSRTGAGRRLMEASCVL